MKDKGTEKKLPLVQRYRFSIETESPFVPPAYPGSMWRGLFGHGLRKIACVTRQPRCDGCHLLATCVYNRVFEGRLPPGEESPRYLPRPHPYVLNVEPLAKETTRDLAVGLSLFQPVASALPYVIHAFVVAGDLGLGPGRIKFRVGRVDFEQTTGNEDWSGVWSRGEEKIADHSAVVPEIPACPEEARVHFRTPLRVKHSGKLLGPAEFQTAHFLRALWRRTNEILQHYEGELELDFPTRKPEDPATLEKDIHWHDWQRYSSRQKTAMHMGGLVGSFRLQKPVLEEWWPLLWYGQWLHLGKATSMGLGCYRVEPI